MGSGDQSAELTREELYAQVWAEPMKKWPNITACQTGGLPRPVPAWAFRFRVGATW